ncbi:MAG: S8 family serine peptidase, partial [Candidatus Aminicenantes bacterium]|nr:S8 family serine peptidase [Candidatus Aminicenantes bacterium]
AVAAILAGLVAYYEKPGDRQEVLPTGEAVATRAAMARIEAESGGTVREPEIQAAPRTAEPPAAVQRPVEDTVPSPPDGYSFVSYHGEMPRARISAGAEAGDEGSSPVPDWLNTAVSIETIVDQASAAGRDWSFGWVRAARDAGPDGVAASLGELGATALGSSGNLVRARLPADPALLHEIAALPEVDGLGAVPPERKLPEAFARELAELSPFDQAPVFITLMADDPDGRWRRKLEDLGAVVGRFDPDLRAYAANVSYGQVEAIAAADYVLAVEPVGIVRPAHDTSVPAMGADALRTWDGIPGIFSGMGGASVPVAVMDTGLNINHLDIASNRESICGANFAWLSFFSPPAEEAADLWIDAGMHGTHVTGTMIGNGTVQPRFAGMAPSVRHIRFARVLGSLGFGTADSIIRGMDFLSEATECAGPGQPPEPVKPLIVNMSLSGSSRRFGGRGFSERKLDSVVWGHRQLYVVAQSNESIDGFSDFGAAKSSLAVGAALDSGDIAFFSSHGPTADGRLAPQVVAAGVRVHSALGGGSRGEYRAISGTSMSSPTVAGVAALLMDAAPEHREHPALARARLMAGAIRPEAWLGAPDAFPSTNTGGPGPVQAQYGLGKVSARTSALSRDGAGGWIGDGAIAELQEGEYAHQDIEVPAGTSRLDLVMTWDEPPADAIASTVLNDLDLWLDRDGDCGEAACGEQSSTSRVDNVEWIILRNPQPGTYRAKVVARRVYTAPPRAALAWTVIRGRSTPNLMVATDRTLLAGNEEQELTVTVTADEYVAAGTRLHLDCRDAGGASGCGQIRIHSMAVSREDGIRVDLSDELETMVPRPQPGELPSREAPVPPLSPIPLGSSIPLGEVAAGESQEVRFTVSSAANGEPARLYFRASAWNARGASAPVDVAPGGTAGSRKARRPANDDFAAAAVIEKGRGFRTVDLLLATPEPGEPLFGAREGRPAGSVWYRWTAPADGAVRFNINPPGGTGAQRNDRVDVFRGDAISGLERVASDQWGALFFAEQGETYRVRVSHMRRGTVVDLRWSQGNRPDNDDFDRAAILEGAAGAVHGSSQGATLEPGEWFGFDAGTTWYRWTAPGDGWWGFSSGSSKRVFVFEGDSIATLRLVSHLPRSQASFPAAAGNEYRIAVAAPGAGAPSGPYVLRWEALVRAAVLDNDQWLGAIPLESVPSSQFLMGIDPASTVDPGEPVETGVRTRWWVWEAPEDGRYTWRLEDFLTYSALRVTVFTGSSMEDLELVAQTRPHAAPTDFVFQAAAGHRYWIAAGFPARSLEAYALSGAAAPVTWGPTPGNDDLAGAAPLEDSAGSVAESNLFATTERGERSALLGHSSLWWTYEAPAAGWYRFWLDDPYSPNVLAVYRDRAGGSGSIEFVRSSDQPEAIESDAVEVLFRGEEGVRYTIRLGARGGSMGGEFTLNWEEAEPPVWLKYAGRLTDGDRDAGGASVRLRGPASLAFNDSGTALYAASELGLQVFERDSRTGGLTSVQLLEDDGLEDSSLIWDPHRDRLYAHRCGTWRSFAPLDEARRELEDQGTIPVTGDPPDTGECGAGVFGDVFMDGGGSFLHAILPGSGQLQVLALDTPGELPHVQTVEVRGLRRALISNAGSHVYAGTGHSLHVFERDAETGMLTDVTKDGNPLPRLEALAITGDDRHLFVFHGGGQTTTVFDLEADAADPSPLGTLRLTLAGPDIFDGFGQIPGFFPFEPINRCGLAGVRHGVAAVDVFCTGLAYDVEWRPGPGDAENGEEGIDEVPPGEVVLTDYVSIRQPDRFNNPVPEFGESRSLAASPDGRHAYVDTADEGIVIFERVGAGAGEAGSEDGADTSNVIGE